MEFVQANQISREAIDYFLKNNSEVDQEYLLQNGYVVKSNQEIIGCFVLEFMKTDVYWLKQLYMIQSKATLLPLLLESILTLAKKEEAKEVCVKSHQPMVDVILKALLFEPTEQASGPNERWWTYCVS